MRKHVYDRLTVRERFLLWIHACARRDEEEITQILCAGPRHRYLESQLSLVRAQAVLGDILRLIEHRSYEAMLAFQHLQKAFQMHSDGRLPDSVKKQAEEAELALISRSRLDMAALRGF